MRSHSNDEKDKKGRYLRHESFSGTCAKAHTHIKWPRRAVTSPPGPFFVSWYLFRREKSWYTENDNSEVGGIRMSQGRIVVITGSPGTGKSTTASLVAKESDMDKSVHMHTDDFYHYLSKGAIPPHLPEANEQNLVVIEAFLEAAKRYARGGYDVIVDGIIGPWFLKPWQSLVREHYEVHYIILRASKEETLKRAVERSKLDRKTNIELVETMWEQFCNLGIYESNVIDTTTYSIQETVSAVQEKIASRAALLS